jgi:hypothetical protein
VGAHLADMDDQELEKYKLILTIPTIPDHSPDFVKDIR